MLIPGKEDDFKMYYRVIRTEDYYKEYLEHSGVKDMKWGVRLYQYKDGSLTPLGRIHYNVGPPREKQKYAKAKRLTDKKDAAKAKAKAEEKEKRAKIEAKAKENEAKNRLKLAEIKYQQKNKERVEKMQAKAAREKAEQASKEAINKLYLEREKTKQMKAEAAKAKAEAERAKEIAYDSDEEYNKKLGEYSDKFADLTNKGASNEELEKLTKEVLAFIDAKNKQVKAVDLASKIANGDKAGAVKLANDMLDNPKNPKTMTKEELEAETARLKAEKAYKAEIESTGLKKSVSNMTDKELKDAIARKQLERDYHDAVDSSTKKFLKKFGEKIIDQAPGKLANAVVNAGEKFIQNKLEKALGIKPPVDYDMLKKQIDYQKGVIQLKNETQNWEERQDKYNKSEAFNKDVGKLSNSQQNTIKNSKDSAEDLAKRFKVSLSTIYALRPGETVNPYARSSSSGGGGKSSSSDSTGDRVTGHGPDGALSKKDRQKLEEAYKNKTSVESVATNLGLTDDAVKNYFKQLEEKD